MVGRPELDGGERYLVECDDPAGNRIGVAVPFRRPTQTQTLVAVRDVGASSRRYQHLLGLRSDHGGSTYERLLADDTLALQLHRFDSEQEHGRIGDPEGELGNGVLLWFGETADFDGVVVRAAELGATIVLPSTRPQRRGTDPATERSGSRTPMATASSSPVPTAKHSRSPSNRAAAVAPARAATGSMSTVPTLRGRPMPLGNTPERRAIDAVAGCAASWSGVAGSSVTIAVWPPRLPGMRGAREAWPTGRKSADNRWRPHFGVGALSRKPWPCLHTTTG